MTYNDIGGCKEQIEKIREVVEMPLLHPERFVQLGIDPPKGVLLYGPPGTGKTLTARAVANRTDACFIRILGSELVQRYVGEGARMVRELFVMARYIFKRLLIFPNEMINGNVGNKGNTLLPSFSWTRSIPSALHVLNLVAVGILKFNVPCWNC